jgi:hypothetical protein
MGRNKREKEEDLFHVSVLVEGKSGFRFSLELEVWSLE